MHKSEPKTNPTLTKHASKVYEPKRRSLGPIWVLAPLESNYEVDSTSYYKKLIEL